MGSLGAFLIFGVAFALGVFLTHPRVQSWNWGTIAQAVGSAATTAAVFAALFKEQWIYFWLRPKLNVVVNLAPPDCHKTQLRVSEVQLRSGVDQERVEHVVPCYYFRLWVSNSGRSPAVNIEVFAKSLDRINADGSLQRVDRFLPMNLKWSHTQSVFKERLSPEMGSHCDLAHFVHPGYQSFFGSLKNIETVDRGAFILMLDTEVIANNGGSLLAPGVYVLTLQVAASNAEPVTHRLRLEFDGDWRDDEREMLCRGISIQTVRSLWSLQQRSSSRE